MSLTPRGRRFSEEAMECDWSTVHFFKGAMECDWSTVHSPPDPGRGLFFSSWIDGDEFIYPSISIVSQAGIYFND